MGQLKISVIDHGEEMEISKKDMKSLKKTGIIKESTYRGEVSIRLAIYNKDGQQVSLDGRVPYIEGKPGTTVELSDVKFYKKKTDEGYYILAEVAIPDDEDEDEEEEEEE